MFRKLRNLFLAALAIGAATSFFRSRLQLPVMRYAVEGPSMQPAFRPGDHLLVNRIAYRKPDPQPGDAIVFRDPDQPSRLLLKRIAAAPSGDVAPPWYWVLGDNATSSRDSRHFGPVHRLAIVGRVSRKY